MEVGDRLNARYESAERLLEDFYARRDAGDVVSFESLVLAHLALEAELRELHSLCDEVNGVLLQGQQAHAAEQAEVQRMLSNLAAPGVFSNRYALEGEVGKGGMGAVLRVRDKQLDRHLAMKVILGQVEASRSGKTPPVAPQKLARFLNEAKITSQLDHPGIVPVHELGVDAEGRAYFTMKLVKGRNLNEVFRLRTKGAPEWTTSRVLGLLHRVCEAVAFAHDQGVIHRDLKPLNVMVGDFGEVYVMDWGLARRIADKAEDVAAPVAADGQVQRIPGGTREGSVMGTAAYMAPEQAAGKLSEMGPWSDGYALGAMLYQLIAGHAPYCQPGEDVSDSAILRRIIAGAPSSLDPKLAPSELIAICDKAMARDVSQRYRSVLELSDDLRAYLEQRVVRAYESGAWAEARKWVQRNRGLAAALAAAILILVVGIIVAEQQSRRADEKAVEAEHKAEDVLSLSAIQELKELVESANALWPAHPDKTSEYNRWIEQARMLIEGRAADPSKGLEGHPSLRDHENKLADIRAGGKRPNREQPLPPGGGDPEYDSTPQSTIEFADAKARWWYGQLSALVQDLHAFIDERHGLYSRGTSEQYGWGILRRLGEAATIEDRSVSGAEAKRRWNEASAAIEKSEKYGGLKLAPQLGLLPIGEDPDSHLWEFAHLQTGDATVRGPDGRLLRDERSGLVLVLVPGGTLWMGADADPKAEHNPDAAAAMDEGPVKPVELSPFFISKYEMTQGQWVRCCDRNPSSAHPPGDDKDGWRISLLNPVETVSWGDSERCLHHFGLELPTEAQWEYSARGGTSSPWFTGVAAITLERFANLADGRSEKDSPDSTICHYEKWDDGWVKHAPVGSYRANRFGLHDTCGNVQEWCLDAYDLYSEPVRPGTGERLSTSDTYRTIRGGAFDGDSNWARSAKRVGNAPETRSQIIGLRPARMLTP